MTETRVRASHALAGAALALGVSILAVQWHQERISAGWIQVLTHDATGAIPSGFGAQLLSHTGIQLVNTLRVGTCLGIVLAGLALVLGRHVASARWVSLGAVTVLFVAIWMQWAWWQHLRWS